MRLRLGNSLSNTYLNARIAIIALDRTLLIELIGFKIIENLNWIDAIYMTAITFSTVGFGVVHGLSQSGKLFTSVVIMLNIATFAYALSVFSYYFIEGKFFHKMKTDIINKRIGKLHGHIIVCGMGRYGEEIIHHFIQHNMKFVMIEIDEERIKHLNKEFPDMLYIIEDATHDDVLLNAGIKNASAIITALPDDSDNVFTVLSARQLNPEINIISRAYEAKSTKKLKLAGANHVIMPEHIGGFYMATLVSKPDAVEFFTFITSENNSDLGFEEVHYDELPEKCKDKSIKETEIRQKTGANIIGFKHPDGSYSANPHPDTFFVKDSSFIVLGDSTQIAALKKFLTK